MMKRKPRKESVCLYYYLQYKQNVLPLCVKSGETFASKHTM